jgi:transposase-like protein
MLNVNDARLARLPRYLREEALNATSRDFPVLPTSALDRLPSLPPEPEDGLTPQQRLAIGALICGQTFSAAAQAAGVSRRTLYAWRRQPAFARALDDLSREALEATAVRVRNLMLRATRVLADAMLGEDSFAGAIRVANSARLWAALKSQAPAPLAEVDALEGADTVADAGADASTTPDGAVD